MTARCSGYQDDHFVRPPDRHRRSDNEFRPAFCAADSAGISAFGMGYRGEWDGEGSGDQEGFAVLVHRSQSIHENNMVNVICYLNKYHRIASKYK